MFLPKNDYQRKRIRIVYLVPKKQNFIFKEKIKKLQYILLENNFKCTIETFQFFKLAELNIEKFKKLKKVLHKRTDELVIFIPNLTEVYLEEPDLVIAFSGYKSWMNPNLMSQGVSRYTNVSGRGIATSK